MLNTEMLARMRSMLDEATAVLYNDSTELYPALSLAQIEIAKMVADSWDVNKGTIPKAIQFLLTVETLTVASGTREATIAAGSALRILSLQWNSSGAVVFGSPYAVEISTDTLDRMILQNSLLSGGNYFYNRNGVLTVNPVSSDNTAEVEVSYFDTPVDITGSVQPELKEVAHDAIVERALWIILKDRETEQANAHLQMFTAMMGGLLK